MSIRTAPSADTESDEQVARRLDLGRRFILAGFADTSLFEGIPRDVVLFLLPDDDPAFAEREIETATAFARQGEDVFLRHVRVAELPE